MKKTELLKRIEILEACVRALEARPQWVPHNPIFLMPAPPWQQPPQFWTPNTGNPPLGPPWIVTCSGDAPTSQSQ